jgi:hypothetical protein
MGVGHHHARHGESRVVDRLAHPGRVRDREYAVDDHQPVGPANQERVDGHHPAFDALDLVDAHARPSLGSLVFFAAPRCLAGTPGAKNEAAAAATTSW